jgi:hypothetical protein
MQLGLARFCLPFIGLAIQAGLPCAALAADQVKISRLTDYTFGPISNFTSDISIARDFCVYSSAIGGRYNVTAYGDGGGGAFTIASGTDTLAYDLQWAGTAGATSGTALRVNTPQGGFTSTAGNQNCSPGNTSTATLIVFLRNVDIAAARAGSYSGILQLTIAPN